MKNQHPQPKACPPIKQNRAFVFLISCACRHVLAVQGGRAICPACQVEHAVRVDSWSIRVAEAEGVAEEPTVSGREGLR